jgi:hypothetical protein
MRLLCQRNILSLFEILSFKDLDYTIPKPIENALDAVEIAKLKAKYYWENLKVKMPIITQDDTFFLENVSDKDNPGIDTKVPVIKRFGIFNDENSVKYYIELAKKYGGEIPFKFKYGHALADENVLEGRASSLPGILVSTPKLPIIQNYPLNSLIKIKVNEVWKYYGDLTEDERLQSEHELAESVTYLIKKYIF